MRPVEVSFPGGTQHRTVAPLCLGSSTFIHSPLIEQCMTTATFQDWSLFQNFNCKSSCLRNE
uniref:Uncharacterized protein n=1 Tax=Aegilops tauschii subsp. strangulata TaxID=200361 RepID=A0A453MFE3_AEGTS